MTAVRIRRATLADAPGIARVHVDSWRSTYAGLVPDGILDSLSYEDRTAQRIRQMESAPPAVVHLVAETDKGEIVGFAVAGPERTGNQRFRGELYAIYLFDLWQGQGIGTLLLTAVASHLLEHGLHSMLVWVLAGNPAERFYAAMGGIPVAEQTIEIGAPLREIGYGWDDIQQLAGAGQVGGRETALE
jgi:L-amino acid N-acyltransferase YncA